MKKRLALVPLALSIPALAQEKLPTPAPPPPEVRKTAEALVGLWSGHMTAIVPGSPPETFPWSIDCRTVALGLGASCSMQGTASIGKLAQECLLAYAPDDKAVHYMCVTSMGEVHDHKGRWTDEKTIEFEPLQGGLMGQSVTEALRWTFPDARTFDTSSTVTMPDGASMRFEFTGRRE